MSLGLSSPYDYERDAIIKAECLPVKYGTRLSKGRFLGSEMERSSYDQRGKVDHGYYGK